MSSFPLPFPSAELTTERLRLRNWSPAEVTDVLADRRSARWAEDFPAEGDRVIAGVIAGRSPRAPVIPARTATG